jgi:hypothetical protein
MTSLLRISLITLVLGPLSFACKTAVPAASTSNRQATTTANTSAKPKPVDPNAPILEFEKTPCFGSCPVYKAQVFKDGYVKFDGTYNVKAIGPNEFRFPKDTLNNLLTYFREVNLFQYDTTYMSGATDLPSTVITFRDQGKEKRIKTEGEGPADMERLLFKTDQLIQRFARSASPRVGK